MILNSTGRFKVTQLIATENRRCQPRRRFGLHLWNEVSVNGERDVDVGMAEHGAHFWNGCPVHQMDRSEAVTEAMNGEPP